MPTSYSGTPTNRASITVPAGSDKPSGSLFSTALEQIWDQILFDQELADDDSAALDDLENVVEETIQAYAYQAQILGTAIADGDYLEINSSTVNEGFATFSIGGGGHELQFPTIASGADNRGLYRVSIDVYLAVNSTADPAFAQVVATLYDSSGPTETTLRQMPARRFNATASDPFMLHGSFLVDMTGLTPALSRLRLKNLSGNDVTIQSGQSRICVDYIGRGSP